MLKDSKAVATVASKDIAAAHAFYSDTLGLPTMVQMDQLAGYQLPDGSALSVYFRPDHRPPENTAITFLVSDIEAEVADLRRRGVTFEDYDLPEIGVRTVDGIATLDENGAKSAWFKDPDGNIIALGTMPPTG
jgi:catechol 2,3-dioxygenase-like lactoylglutathione lyase family enzyme